MSPAVRRKKRDEIKMTISPFRGLTDYKSCVDIQREVWRFEDIDIYPTGMLIATDQCGGLALGAYNSIGEMIGFAYSVLSTEDGKLAQHSLTNWPAQLERNPAPGVDLARCGGVVANTVLVAPKSNSAGQKRQPLERLGILVVVYVLYGDVIRPGLVEVFEHFCSHPAPVAVALGIDLDDPGTEQLITTCLERACGMRSQIEADA